MSKHGTDCAAPLPDRLDAVLEDIWARLMSGARDRRAAFHTPVLATREGDGVEARTVVLREAGRAPPRLVCHTDIRSHKIRSLRHMSQVSWCFYDAAAARQVRARGDVSLHWDDALANGRWDDMHPAARRTYLVHPGPGVATAGPASGLPEYLRGRMPAPDEAEAGRANFAVLVCHVDALDWLALSATGNRRAGFRLRDGEWRGGWLVP